MTFNSHLMRVSCGLLVGLLLATLLTFGLFDIANLNTTSVAAAVWASAV